MKRECHQRLPTEEKAGALACVGLDESRSLLKGSLGLHVASDVATMTTVLLCVCSSVLKRAKGGMKLTKQDQATAELHKSSARVQTKCPRAKGRTLGLKRDRQQN